MGQVAMITIVAPKPPPSDEELAAMRAHVKRRLADYDAAQRRRAGQRASTPPTGRAMTKAELRTAADKATAQGNTYLARLLRRAAGVGPAHIETAAYRDGGAV